MSLYNSRGNYNVTVNETTIGKGLYAADGSLRVTSVSGSAFTGLMAADGSLNVVTVVVSDTPYSLYHPCGAIRGISASSEIGLFAPNGALYLSGLSAVTGPTNGILLEDGTSFLLAETGDYLVQE